LTSAGTDITSVGATWNTLPRSGEEPAPVPSTGAAPVAAALSAGSTEPVPVTLKLVSQRRQLTVVPLPTSRSGFECVVLHFGHSKITVPTS
jgi:hypothetical protein